MFEGANPVRWTGKLAVVTLPEHIDVSNAGQIREDLLSVINRGAAALIADMHARCRAIMLARMLWRVPTSVLLSAGRNCGWWLPRRSSSVCSASTGSTV